MDTVHSNWHQVRLGSILKAKALRGRPDLPLLSVIRERGVIVRDLEDLSSNHNAIPKDLSNYKIVNAGDLVINKMKAWQGSAGIAPINGIVSPAYFVFEANLEDKRYAHYLFRSRFFVDNYARCSDGVRIGQWDLNMTAIKNLRIPKPSNEDQHLIGKYLDHLEIKIAKALKDKRKLLSLLNEQKQIVICGLVTRGTNPKARMKDSGQAWIGEMPSHWEIVRLGSVLEERAEMNESGKVTQVLSLLRRRGVLLYEDKGRIGNKKSENIRRYKIVRENDIVVNCMNVIIGSVGISSYMGCLSPVYYVLKERNAESSSAYFNNVFQIEPFHKSLVRYGKGILAHRMRISMLDLKAVLVPKPPISEQVEINKAIAVGTAGIDKAIQAVEREISLLMEYRTVVISEVVTGKKNIRAEATLLGDVNPTELAQALSGAVITDGAEDEGDGPSKAE